jgi:hypothetical protein
MSRESIGNRRRFDRLPGGGYALALIDDGVRIEIRYLRRRWQQLYGEIDVQCEWKDIRHFEGSLSCGDLNLSSPDAIESRGKHCAKRAKARPEDVDWWVDILDEACRRVIQAERNGLEPIVLDDAPAAAPPRDFLVHGLAIPADSHSQLVADGSGLKSLLLLLVLGEMAKDGRPVLYLDWEWNEARHLARKHRLFGAARLESLFYLRCRNALAIEADHVRRFCESHHVQFCAIDSIGACCDGKLADDDVARAYNHALDQLPPTLAAAHIPKNGNADQSADLKAFGSAFFHNYARMTWTVKKQPNPTDEDRVAVLLVPHKQNDGARLRPVALEFGFSPERINVRSVEPTAVEGLAHTLPVHTRMVELLKRGPLTIAQIAEELEAKVDTVTKAANRSQAFTKLANAPDGIQRIALAERRSA